MYPKIEHIDDVMFALQDEELKKVFCIKKNDQYSSIFYNIQFPGMFEGETPEIAAMRKEFRGLIFDKNGYVHSRPFHKFFNLNQHPSTQEGMIFKDKPLFVMEKYDGSTLRPVFLDNGLQWFTKAGNSDVAVSATNYVNNHMKYGYDFFENLIKEKKITPIFEYMSVENRVVIPHDKTKITLIGARDTITGEYLDAIEIYNLYNDIFYYTTHATEENIFSCRSEKYLNFDAVINKINSDEHDKEGYVCIDDNGTFVKMKMPWYVNVHGALDGIVFTRNVIQNLYNDTLDDVWGYLSDEDKARCQKIIIMTTELQTEMAYKIVEIADKYKHLSGKELFDAVNNEVIKYPIVKYIIRQVRGQNEDDTMTIAKNIIITNINTNIAWTTMWKEWVNIDMPERLCMV
jgi:RNA ligase